MLEIDGVRRRIERGDTEIPLRLDGEEFIALLQVSQRQRQSLLAGGTLNRVRSELHDRSNLRTDLQWPVLASARSGRFCVLRNRADRESKQCW